MIQTSEYMYIRKYNEVNQQLIPQQQNNMSTHRKRTMQENQQINQYQHKNQTYLIKTYHGLISFPVGIHIGNFLFYYMI